MAKTRTDNLFWLVAILLFCTVKPSYQTVYSCNTTASCGCSTEPVSITRIVGGESAGASTWGWAVSVSIGDTYLCGGSIISSSWVITAAHCVIGFTASQVTIYAGSTTVFSGIQRVGSNLIVHPNYNGNTYTNDIALLQLDSPLSTSDPGVSTICLPSVDAATLAAGEWPPVGTSVVAVGWGTLTQGGSLPTNLQQVTVQTVAYNADTCVGAKIDWHVQLCAGVSGGGKDTCQGDSGGPLMMYTSSNQWVLVGLTSNGIGCAQATDSGVYTRVAAFQDWINTNTNDAVSTLPTPIEDASNSTEEAVSTSTSFMIISHANTLKTSTITILTFALSHFLCVWVNGMKV